MSNQSARQASVRAVTGTAFTYEGDWHALWNLQSIPQGTFNERMLAWIRQRLGFNYINVNSAMAAFAISQGVTDWNSLGTFNAGGYPWNASSGQLPPGSTFSRTTAARDFNSSGVSQVYGVNQPRYGYNPQTLAFRGLRIEPSSTNVVLQSRTYNTTWVSSGITLTSGQASPKFGDNGAWLLEATGNTNRIEQGITVTTNPQYVYSIFAAGTSTTPQLRVDNNGLAYSVIFDTVNMTTTPGSGGGTGPVSNVQFIPLGNNFYMGGFSYTPGATSTIVRQYPRIGNAVVDHIQHEEGSSPTSIIVTTTTATIRDADVLTLALPYASNNITFTFDNDTTQTINGVPATYVVPTNLNRPWIKTISVVSA